jgi:3-dehydroquinate synthetase
MLVAGELSKNLGLLAPKELELLRAAIRLCGPLPAASDVDEDAIMEVTTRDKKSVAGQINWILLERLGRARMVAGHEIDQKVLRAALRQGLKP